ncbi:MAG TPA: hypothetical protein VFZ61_11535 [Polyangiales bacterium]
MRWSLNAVLGLVCAGCTPLVATVGVEGEDGTTDAGDWIEPTEASAPDAGTTDAAATPADDAASGEDAAEVDADAVRNCIVLPDLVDVMARTDAGISALDSGVIWVATDMHESCPTPALNTHIYGRVDGSPIVPSGAAYSIRWPATIGTGAVTMMSTNLQCGGEPLVIPFFISWIIPLIEGCSAPPPGSYMRIVMTPPSPFPLGLRLCEGGCP